MNHCLRSKDYINLIIADKQPQWQWLDMKSAIEHCTKGASCWQWASNDYDFDPDVVLACAGDVPTAETIAATWLLRKHIPDLRVRVVNIVDLMVLKTHKEHPIIAGLAATTTCPGKERDYRRSFPSSPGEDQWQSSPARPFAQTRR